MSLLLNLDDENCLPINYFDIFPNPASESISIEIKSEINTEFYINIYNIQGILIRRLVLDQNKRSIDVSNLNKGIYIYEIIQTQKFKEANSSSNKVICRAKPFVVFVLGSETPRTLKNLQFSGQASLGMTFLRVSTNRIRHSKTNLP